MPKTTKKKETEIKQNKERGGLLTTDGKREIWQGCQLLEISPPPRCMGSVHVDGRTFRGRGETEGNQGQRMLHGWFLETDPDDAEQAVMG